MKQVYYSILVVLFLLLSESAWAGMPYASMTLTEIGVIRLQNISFFLFVILAASLIIQWIWNFLQKDFNKLPRLTYTKSITFVSIWGLAFYLVLGMVAGARELMTPKAWEKQGALYQLKNEPDSNSPLARKLEAKRRSQLEKSR